MIGKITGVVMVLLFCITTRLVAQTGTTPNPILTADSLATGNYKDVLNSFFQFAFDRLTSPDKTLKFTGTPFAVMAKLDTVLLERCITLPSWLEARESFRCALSAVK